VSLRTLLLLAFGVSVGLIIAVGASSYWLNREIEARVDQLRSGPGADLARIDVRHHGLEIEGFWDERGFFVARELDLLPGKRRPKLRGPVQAIDLDRGTLRVFGMEIRVGANAEFAEGPGAARGIEDLHPGQRIEISARVEEGRWLARKLRTAGVKRSDKIKGTPTRVDLHPTGGALDVDGLRIVLPEADGESAGSALRELRLATLMTVVLQELRSAARELVGRTGGWDVAETSLPGESDASDAPAPTAEERLEGAGQAFAYYLEQLESSVLDPFATGPVEDSPLRLLSQQFNTLEEQLGTLVALSARDLDRASTYLDDVVDPHLGQTMLPVVYALRGDAEETLSDQVREISAWARTTMRVAVASSLLAVIVAMALGAIVWRSIGAPVRALHNAALSIGRGHLETRVELKAPGELGVLANAFDRMAEALAGTTVSVKSLESIFDSIAGIVVTTPTGGSPT
jgi:HAMP domain-containing protein